MPVNSVPFRESYDFYVGFRKPDLGSTLYTKGVSFKKFFFSALVEMDLP